MINKKDGIRPDDSIVNKIEFGIHLINRYEFQNEFDFLETCVFFAENNMVD